MVKPLHTPLHRILLARIGKPQRLAKQRFCGIARAAIGIRSHEIGAIDSAIQGDLVYMLKRCMEGLDRYYARSKGGEHRMVPKSATALLRWVRSLRSRRSNWGRELERDRLAGCQCSCLEQVF